jgi:murein L,D-transpeptidase YafK
LFRFILLASALAFLGVAVYAAGGAPRGGSDKPLKAGAKADLVLVEKVAHRLTLYAHGRVLKTYTISIGSGGMEPKMRQGDDLTPEGSYTIDARDAQSCCYRSLHISYPSAADRAVAKARGMKPGGDVAIHGLRNYMGFLGGLQRLMDWTNGTIAVTDDEMDELWRAVPNGTPIRIQH